MESIDEMTSPRGTIEPEPLPDRYARLLVNLSASLAAHDDAELCLAEMAKLAAAGWADLVTFELSAESSVRALNPSLDEACARLLLALAEESAGLELRRRAADSGEAQLSSALMAAPLNARGRTLGVCWIARCPHREAFLPEDLALFRELSDRAARTLDHAHLCQEADQARGEREQLLATISHELRTPLTAILGWSHLLRAAPLDSGMRTRALESIERNARSQTRLVEDLLDLSRALSGHLRLNLAPLSLAAVAESVLDGFRAIASSRGIMLRSDLDRRAPLILGDQPRLRQVIGHLLSNAVKFTPSGGEISVMVRGESCRVVLEICDTGEGIRPTFLPYAFDLFTQADASSTRRHGGMGVGLTIVRQLTELHGGAVQAESDGEGHGALFRLWLPVARDGSRVPPRRIERGDPDGPLHPGVLRGVRVLVVDEDAETLAMIATVLGLCGAEVRTRARPDALELARFRPDVILGNATLPEGASDAIHLALPRPVEPQELVSTLRRALFRAA